MSTVHKRVFVKKNESLIELTEDRTDIITIDVVQTMKNLAMIMAEIDGTVDKFPAVIKQIKKKVKDYNQDLKVMTEANEELELGIDMPKPLVEAEVLDRITIEYMEKKAKEDAIKAEEERIAKEASNKDLKERETKRADTREKKAATIVKNKEALEAKK